MFLHTEMSWKLMIIQLKNEKLFNNNRSRSLFNKSGPWDYFSKFSKHNMHKKIWYYNFFSYDFFYLKNKVKNLILKKAND